MKAFHELMSKIISSREHDKMRKFVAPLNDHFGINHFWYYKITDSGLYTYVGSHTPWSEFCFDSDLTSLFSCLRHPKHVPNGISLMKASEEASYHFLLKTAWDKFQINFNINLVTHIPGAIEAFGFGTRFNDPQSDQRLLNELPLLRHFINAFRNENKKLFQLLDENKVNLITEFGPVWYERPKATVFPPKRNLLLKKLGLGDILLLTARERDILKFLAYGYPASFIGIKLKLSTRTVENYIASIKSKLMCDSKVELIEKANEVNFLSEI